jgi:hypothetical protein
VSDLPGGIELWTADIPLPPAAGWHPDDFPKITTDLIPYASKTFGPDPFMTITEQGWLYIEVGNVRLAIPDLEEWNKFTHMAGCMWNAHRLAQRTTSPQGEEDHGSNPDQGSGCGSPTPADHPEPGPCGEPGTQLPTETESG